MRIGYVPYSESLSKPGDLRRFVAYARERGIKFEFANPNERYDLVVLSEAADITMWENYSQGKIVYDLIDSFLAIPKSNIKHWLREPLWYLMGRRAKLRFNPWRLVESMCRKADVVVCTTEEQKRDISHYCSNVHIVLDVHESVVKAVKKDYGAQNPFRIVWEGLPNNIAQLKTIKSVLHEISANTPLVLNLVTDLSQPRFLGRFGSIESMELAKEVFDVVNVYAWSEENCSEVVRNSDLAIIPIDLSDPFVFGKPENKLLLLWRMGIPVVASATPAYSRTFAAAGMEDLVCKKDSQWRDVLNNMIQNDLLRQEVGCRGREFAESYHSKDLELSRWDNVFLSLGFDFTKKQHPQ
jgi:glycosyltransferase involved in cell wall biosynthesis